MSGNWKHTLKKISIGLLLIVVLLVAYRMGVNIKSQIRCSKIEITVKDSLETRFISSKDVMNYLNEDFKGLIGMPADSIDLYKIEKLLTQRGGILTCEAYLNNSGTLNITVTQRKPALRFKAEDFSFYSTSDGFLLPIQGKDSLSLLTIEGYIPIDSTEVFRGRPEDITKQEWLDNVTRLGVHVYSNRVWKDRIAKIMIEESGEITITPRTGREVFLFGHPKDIEDKFEKMQLYYQRITADKGDDAYNVVDLRFKGQIVCKDTEKK